MAKEHVGRQIIFSGLAVLVTAGICYPFSEHIGYRSVALILLLVLSVLALRQGLPAVLTAAVLSALVWDYFFIPPHFTFHIDSAEDALFMAMYFIVATLNGMINHRYRQIEALRREKRADERSLLLYNTLFSSLSHDLRTPIAAVLGAADTLKENEKQLSETQKKQLIEEISKGSVRLSEQVENLLNMSRIEAGIIKPKSAWCDVRDLALSSIKNCPIDQQGRSIKLNIDEHTPLVQLDFGLTEHVLHNLLTNALRHTPPGSLIELSAKIRNESHGRFVTNDQDQDLYTVKQPTEHFLVLEVRDNGKGFPPDEIHLVFDKFYRLGGTKADGTGLGLFVAKGLTEAQGGEIFLRNLPEGGACFTIEIPTTILNQAIHQHD